MTENGGIWTVVTSAKQIEMRLIQANIIHPSVENQNVTE